jgi:hypothetical protein
MAYLPTLYKARRVPTKQPVCAICAERTRGRTQQVRLGYGVSVWLCADHASREFQTQRNGRDFVLTLQRLWEAHGCMTASRGKALTAHLSALRTRPARPRPGSYAWPELRRALERRFAAGGRPAAAVGAVAHLLAGQTCSARPPSRRTVHRWHSERRWITSPRPPPA